MKSPQADVLPGLPDGLCGVPPKARDYQHRTLDEAIARSHELLDEVQERYPAEQILLLFSGGGDSTLVSHLMRHRADTVVHINTGTGVPATRQYVKDVDSAWGLPYVEAHPPDSYRDLVLGRVKARRTQCGEGGVARFPRACCPFALLQPAQATRA